MTSSPVKDARLPKSILIVDDNMLFLKGLARIFAKSGWTVVTRATGNEALEQVQQQDFDVILLDYQMPDMDGIETVRRIRAFRGKTRDTPVIGISIDDDPQLAKACREAGMDDFVTKHAPSHVIEGAVMALVE